MSSNKKVGSEFICPIKYHNELPNVQFPPKILPVTSHFLDKKIEIGQSTYVPQNIYNYSLTTLEEALPYPLLVDSELTMPIDLISMGLFDVPDSQQIKSESSFSNKHFDDIDLILLGQRPITFLSDKLNDKIISDSPALDSDLLPSSKTFKPNTDKATLAHPNSIIKAEAESTFPLSYKTDNTNHKKRKSLVFDDSLQGQKDFTNKIMEDAFKMLYDKAFKENKLKALVHPTDKKSKAIDIIPLLPNKKTWQNKYTIFTFDELPSLDFLNSADFKNQNPDVSSESIAKLSEYSFKLGSMLRPREQPSSFGPNKIWLEYFLPDSATTVLNLDKKKTLENLDNPIVFELPQDENMEFKYAKSYEFASTLNNFKQEHYLISLESKNDNDFVAYYTPIASRFIMKRKKLQSNSKNYSDSEDSMFASLISVGFRETNKAEKKQIQTTLEELEPQPPNN
ncbi:hypothetical protein BB561_005272 [Smittium simulii]|uniref:Uncharacterized protein n=1 Tax=Smittium simulii TaxID=133385 RepID=A0A2T9YBA9_9FUNG|nr:hypothetical protein BB561_005272 [Smittium simulii]